MITDYKSAVDNIRAILKTYIIESNIKSLVLGISGGIDSALSVALAKPVCDELGIPLIGRSITIETNKADEISRAKAIGESFVTDFKEVNLTDGFVALAGLITEIDNETESVAYKIRRGNIKARTRMVYLYDLASKNKGMVLSTDNYTELLLGFWTLHGDVGDYGMIQNLWKTEVYAMSRYIVSQLGDDKAKKALQDCIVAVATDGLGITNSDLDQIQAKSYEEVDQILLKQVYNTDDFKDFENHPVIQRKRNSEFKRNNPYNIPREGITSVPL
ncbi:MAG: NAD(+) synthase [Bacteroidetes bacterium 4572_117]|nr:MAG: NAD(+) synthase [Bacteroidetes bacterium 4572_117]